MAKRRLKNWLDTYIEYHAALKTPPLFPIWTGLWTIGAALERKVWCRTMSKPVFPNLYIFLVSSSGAGKGNSLQTAREFVSTLYPNEATATSSITSAFLAQSLQGAKREWVNPLTNRGEVYHSVNIASAELQVLIPEYNLDMLAKLTDMYDCLSYGEGRRSDSDTFSCSKTFVSMLGATTESHFFTTFPEAVFSTGFMSRIVIVHAESGPRQSLFLEKYTGKELLKMEEDMMEDLKHFQTIRGEFKFSDDARELIDAFYTYPGNMGGAPIPDHPNLSTYCERRHLQIEKTMIINSVMRDDELLLTEEDYHWAYNLLMETEEAMPGLFKSSHDASEVSLVDQCLHTIAKNNAKGKYPSKDSIIAYLAKKTQFYNAERLFTLISTRGVIVPSTEAPGGWKAQRMTFADDD